MVQDLPALLAPHPLDGAAAVRSVLRHRAEGLEGGAADALLEQDSIVDYWAAVSQLAKARDEIRKLKEDIRKLKEDNHANAQPG